MNLGQLLININVSNRDSHLLKTALFRCAHISKSGLKFNENSPALFRGISAISFRIFSFNWTVAAGLLLKTSEKKSGGANLHPREAEEYFFFAK